MHGDISCTSVPCAFSLGVCMNFKVTSLVCVLISSVCACACVWTFIELGLSRFVISVATSMTS